jgi:hypothetical protein
VKTFWVACSLGVLTACAAITRGEEVGPTNVWTLRQWTPSWRTCAQIWFEGEEVTTETVGTVSVGRMTGIESPEFCNDDDEQELPATIVPGPAWITCRVEQVVDGVPARMVCSAKGEAVTFLSDGPPVGRAISGRWGDKRSPRLDGAFTLARDGRPCGATTEQLLAGVVLWRRPRLEFDAHLRSRLERRSTVRDLLRVVGPGYIGCGSGTGTIHWIFTDGATISAPSSVSVADRVTIPGR